MNMINVNESNLTMDSLEIAEYTGKEHRNVKRDIKEMLTELELPLLKFEHIYFDHVIAALKQFKKDKGIVDER